MGNTNTPNIVLSENAAKKVNDLVSDQANATKLRISVEGGGCSGFQYKYDFVDVVNQEDLVLQKNGAIVLIDPVSADLLKNSTIDFVETLGSAEFSITNPNSTSRCGCGNSFSI